MKKKNLEIITYGNDILRKIAAPVEKIDQDVVNLCREMIQSMKAAKGIGLAAPQVGVSKRIIVVLQDPERAKALTIINPEIIECEGEIKGEEGCLSLPGIIGEVNRCARVLVRGLDKKGAPFEIEGTEILGRVFQHEIDHLDGKLFIDRFSFVRRKLINKKLRQLKQETLAKLTGVQ